MTDHKKLLAVLKELLNDGVEFESLMKPQGWTYQFTREELEGFIYEEKYFIKGLSVYLIPEIIEVEGWCKKIFKGENYYFVCGYYELENYYEYEMFIIDWTNRDNSRRVGASVETNRLLAVLTIYRDLRKANKLNQNKEK